MLYTLEAVCDTTFVLLNSKKYDYVNWKHQTAFEMLLLFEFSFLLYNSDCNWLDGAKFRFIYFYADTSLLFQSIK